jgi:hypothetical protein
LGLITVGAKDKTIDAFLERDRETNHLVAGSQKMLPRYSSGPQDLR